MFKKNFHVQRNVYFQLFSIFELLNHAWDTRIPISPQKIQLTSFVTQNPSKISTIFDAISRKSRGLNRKQFGWKSSGCSSPTHAYREFNKTAVAKVTGQSQLRLRLQDAATRTQPRFMGSASTIHASLWIYHPIYASSVCM